MNVTASAPAKINIVLAVGPRRDDGFHDLITVFHAVDVRDTVTVEPAPAGSGVTMSVEGHDAESVPLDGTNLAARAATLLAERTGRTPDVRIHINKRIPVAGGMAGGSADAAATLVACDALWRTRLTRLRLQELGAELGSDIPFALHGGTMIGQGRGERLTPVLTRSELHWVISPVAGGLSTPQVYARFDEMHAGAVAEPTIDEAVMSALRSDDPQALAPILRNDLQEAALSMRPDLAEVLSDGMRFGALGGIVSGSGPTCVFLNADRVAAVATVAALRVARGAQAAFAATGPAPGAHVEE